MILLLLILASCASPTPLYPRQPLAEQRLAPRPGFKGLTNQVCIERDPKKSSAECSQMETVDYDLNDPGIRDRFIAINLICKVNGKRFRVAPDRPGLITSERKSWLRPVKEVEFIDINTGYQRLLDSNTYCTAQDSVLGRTMFFGD